MKILFLYVCINCMCRYLLRIIVTIILNKSFNILCYLEKSSDEFMKSKMEKKYISVTKLRRTIIVKVKYILKFLQQESILISNKLSRKIINIKVVFKICIFNVVILAILLRYYNIDFTFTYQYIKNYIPLLNDIKGYLWLIALMPVFYMIWSYVDIRIKFYDIRDSLYKRIEELRSGVLNNIEELNTYNMSRRIENISQEITDDIGFKFINGKLEVNSRDHVNNYISDNEEMNLVIISKMIDEVETIINKRNLNDNFLINNLYLYSLDEETIVINYKYNERYLKNSEYFKKYHNQIYKKTFTNARVVRKECLSLLEERKKSSELWLQDYESTLKKYSINLLVLQLNIDRYYKHLDGVIFTNNIIQMIKVIIIESLKFYCSLTIRVLY